MPVASAVGGGWQRLSRVGTPRLTRKGCEREGLAAGRPPDARSRTVEVDDWSCAPDPPPRSLTLARLTPAYRDAHGASRSSPSLCCATGDGAPAATPRRSTPSTTASATERPRQALGGSSAHSCSPDCLNWAMSYVQSVPHRLGRRADPGRPPRSGCSDHLQRLSLGFYERTRAGVIIQPAHERRRGDRPARDRRRHKPRAELALTLLGTAILLFILDWRLALAARSQSSR